MQCDLEQKVWTEEALMALPDDGRKYELVAGNLVMSPTGFQHGYISLRLATALMDFALSRQLGVVVDSSTGFRMRSGNCRSPDVSFVRKERLGKGLTKKFFQGAPDLAVEVLSPEDTLETVRAKLVEYFANGTKLAWVIRPEDCTVLVWSSPEASKLLRARDQLDGEGLLPGFTFPVGNLFAEPSLGS
jgi:Uma2 family endonuclease